MLAKRGIKINRPSGEELRILHGEINDKKILFLYFFVLYNRLKGLFIAHRRSFFCSEMRKVRKAAEEGPRYFIVR